MKESNYIKLEFPSSSVNEGFARTAAAAFASQLDPTLEELGDIKTAVSEAVTNAIVHGYRKENGIVRVRASYDEANLLTVEIGDRGCGIANIWQARQPFYTTADGEERSGMGFTVMESFMDGVDVESKAGFGTNVRMRKQLSMREASFARRA